MYVKYTPTASATAVQVWQDICSLLTGAALADLSASCDKTLSQYIASTTASPWTLHDDAASATAKVFKSLNIDGTYKYLHVSYSSTTITFMLYETWDAASHTGTNEACFSTAVSATPQILTVTTVPTWIIATANNTIFTQGILRSVLIGEFSRENPAINSSYPCSFIGGLLGTAGISKSTVTPSATGLSYVGLCRIKYALSTGDLKKGSTPAYTYPIAGLAQQWSDHLSHMGVDKLSPTIRQAGSETVTYLVRPFYVQASFGLANSVSSLGKVPELLHITATANHLDEIVINSTTYVMVSIAKSTQASGMYVLIPKG